MKKNNKKIYEELKSSKVIKGVCFLSLIIIIGVLVASSIFCYYKRNELFNPNPLIFTEE